MKNIKYVFSFYVIFILLAGAGCGPILQNKSVSEDANWYLSFDLPNNWIMTAGCKNEDATYKNCDYGLMDPLSETPIPKLDLNVNKNNQIIYLQNTEKLTLFGGIAPVNEKKDYFQSDNVALITVSKVENPSLPEDAIKTENLGNDFYKITDCSSDDCEIYGTSKFYYYLVKSPTEHYKFTFTRQSVDISEIEKIILSAK